MVYFGILPAFIFVIGLIVILSTPESEVSLDKRMFGFAALITFNIIVWAYAGIVGWHYHEMMNTTGKKLHMSKYEPDYFAIQTMTTVGYGVHLCDCNSLKDESEPMTLPEKRKLNEEFHALSTKAMCGWAILWVGCGPFVYFYVRRVIGR